MANHHAAAASAQYPGAPLLLDRFGGALFAVSMRRLTESYTGPCLRAIRDYDDAEIDIPFMSNGLMDAGALATWAAAVPGPPSAGSRTWIVKWYDQSGNGNDLLAPSPKGGPSLSYTTGDFTIMGGDSGLPAVYGAFEGTQQLTLAGSGLTYTNSGAWSATVVMDYRNYRNRDHHIFNLANSSGNLMDFKISSAGSTVTDFTVYNTGGSAQAIQGSIVYDASYPWNVYNYFLNRDSDGDFKIYKDNTLEVSGTQANPATTSPDFQLYARDSGGANNDSGLEGAIGEVIWWPQSRSADDIDLINQNISNYWG